MQSTEAGLLINWKKVFATYKDLGEKAIRQVPDDRLFWTFYNDSNSIGIIVQHMSGNMISRFTNFYEEDGEKPWRNRDREFESVLSTRQELIDEWETGWACFMGVLNTLSADDLARRVMIRGESHAVLEAINRQLAHFSYHVGQLVFLSKMLAKDGWESLSIPKGGSEGFNPQQMPKS